MYGKDTKAKTQLPAVSGAQTQKIFLLKGSTYDKIRTNVMDQTNGGGTQSLNSKLNNHVYGTASSDLDPYYAVKLTASVYGSETDDNSFNFCTDLTFMVEEATEGDEETHIIGIPQSVVPSNSAGRIVCSGICAAYVDVSDSSHKYAKLPSSAGPLESTADVTDIKIVDTSSTGLELRHVRLGGGGGGGTAPIVPVELTQVGGTQGTGTTPATWTYDVTDAMTGEQVLTAADPVNPPHHYARPNVGQVTPADFGLAWKKLKDPAPPEGEDPYEYELTWINEALIGAICEEEENDSGEGNLAPSAFDGGVAQYSLATSTGSITNVETTLPFDTELNTKSWSSNASGEITLQPGGYIINASVTPDQTAGNNRIELKSVVQSDSSGSWSDIAGTERRHYSRLNSHTATSATVSFFLNVESAHAIRVQTRRVVGSSSVVCQFLSDACSIMINRVAEAEISGD